MTPRHALIARAAAQPLIADSRKLGMGRKRESLFSSTKFSPSPRKDIIDKNVTNATPAPKVKRNEDNEDSKFAETLSEHVGSKVNY